MSERCLTALQVRIGDEIEADTRAAEATLKVAMNYYANCMVQIDRRKSEFWKELRELHGLSEDRAYGFRCVNGRFMIVEIEDKEGGR